MKHLFFALGAVVILAGCGGGGGGSADPVAPDPTFDQGILGFVHTVSDARAR